jgi:N-alpha-acetyltransferase 38, NatC auxiliary subunit
MEEAEAQYFLESLLDKTLHCTAIDGRLFTGTFRCTDNESNIILSNAFEYRMPSPAAEKAAIEKTKATGQTSKADMTSRFVGLIVVPGKQIAKIEVEEKREWSANQSLSVRAKT